MARVVTTTLSSLVPTVSAAGRQDSRREWDSEFSNSRYRRINEDVVFRSIGDTDTTPAQPPLLGSREHFLGP
jgi:hypothetical protein